MYLEHFGFSELPFTLTPNLQFFCNLKPYQEALDVLAISLKNGEGFIKITGEVGTGKTLLCRKLLTLLEPTYPTVYIPNPNLDFFGLQKTMAHDLGIKFPKNVTKFQLTSLLNEKLVNSFKDNKPIVIIIDEAQVLQDETLEGIRLLSNLETESSKLVQIVLFGQPELDKRLNKHKLRQLKQRITFSYTLPALTGTELSNYISHRLIMGGYKFAYDSLFTKSALKLLAKASRGIPRLINIICNKALLITYGQNKTRVTAKAIHLAIQDTESVMHPFYFLYYFNNTVVIIIALIIAIIGYIAIKVMPT